MPTQRAARRASPRALKPEQIITRRAVKLRRVTPFGGAGAGKAVMLAFEDETRRAQQSRCGFLHPHPVSAFEGKEAWFEVEQVSLRSWACTGAVRPVAPAADA